MCHFYIAHVTVRLFCNRLENKWGHIMLRKSSHYQTKLVNKYWATSSKMKEPAFIYVSSLLSDQWQQYIYRQPSMTWHSPFNGEILGLYLAGGILGPLTLRWSGCKTLCVSIYYTLHTIDRRWGRGGKAGTEGAKPKSGSSRQRLEGQGKKTFRSVPVGGGGEVIIPVSQHCSTEREEEGRSNLYIHC